MSRQNDEKKFTGSNKKSQAQKAQETWGEGKFISINLSKDEKEQFAEYPDRWEKNQMDAIAPVLEANYKLGLKWNRKLGCYQCTITGLEACDGNEGVTLSTYHIDPTRAVAIMLYSLSNRFCLDRQWAANTQGYENDW